MPKKGRKMNKPRPHHTSKSGFNLQKLHIELEKMKEGFPFNLLVEEERLEVLKLLNVKDLIRFERVNKDMFRLVQVVLGSVKAITPDDIPCHIQLYSDGHLDGIRLLTRCPKIKVISQVLCFNNNFEVMSLIAQKCPEIEKLNGITHTATQVLLHYLRALDGKAKIKEISYMFDMYEAEGIQQSSVSNQLIQFAKDVYETIKLSPKLEELDFRFKWPANSLHDGMKFIQILQGVISSKRITKIVLHDQAVVMFLALLLGFHGTGSKLKTISMCTTTGALTGDVSMRFNNYAPNVEKLRVRSVVVSFVRGLVNLEHLKDLELSICPQKQNQAYIEDINFFLRERGKQLTRLSLKFCPECPTIDLTDSVREYCPNLIELSGSLGKLDLKRLSPLNKLRVLVAYVGKKIYFSDLETLLDLNRKLRRLTLELPDKKTYSEVEKYLKDTAILRERKYPRLRVQIINIADEKCQ